MPTMSRADRPGQSGLGKGSKVTHGLYSEPLQGCQSGRADTRQRSHGEGVEELELVTFRNMTETVGFGRLRSQFGDQLVRRHPDRCGKTEPLPDLLTHLLAHFHRRPVVMAETGDVEE